MPKSLVLGNGNMFVGLDQSGQVTDFYYPQVGLESHMKNVVHKIGIWVDGQFSWIDDGSWDIKISYRKTSLVSDITAVSQKFGLRIRFNDSVYNEKNIFLRKVVVDNLTENHCTVKIFFNQQFTIYSTDRGITAYYDPHTESIIHYKGRRIFSISGLSSGKVFDDYTVGLFHIEGKEGTYRDAEDGHLSKNPIEHGSVDSTIAFTISLSQLKSHTLFYWIVAAKKISEVEEGHLYVRLKTPAHLIESTDHYWRAWSHKSQFNLLGLDRHVHDLFLQSLLIMRAHVDNDGGIIASGDGDLLQYGRDTYTYVWPRDAALISMTFDRAGYFNITKKFYEFCEDVLLSDGYLLHKYLPDRSFGSSWHPWIYDGKVQLPIQEDETALVLYGFWEHYAASRDLEFVEQMYNPLIKKSADFLVSYRDLKTHLPLPSYDLWEEKRGVSTFTTSAIIAALLAAARFAELLGKRHDYKKYFEAARETKAALLTYLYNKESGYFYKMLEVVNNTDVLIPNHTIDASSFYGLFRFDILDVTDIRMKKFMDIVSQRIVCKSPIGGVARYEDDEYHRTSKDVPGNPWFITTLWLAQYHIACAKNDDDLEIVRHYLTWVTRYKSSAHILSEQINPYTGSQISATPLTWSHAEFVMTVILYLEKLEKLGICKVCLPFK